MNKVKKERLDVLLVERGFFETRENAKRHIMAGIILVNDVLLINRERRYRLMSDSELKGMLCHMSGVGDINWKRR